MVNYFNPKEATGLSDMSTVEGLEVDNGKVLGIGDSCGKPSYC